MTDTTVTDKIVSSLLGDSDIASLIGDRVFAASSFGVREETTGNLSVPATPYLSWIETSAFLHQEVRETAASSHRYFQIFIYDDIGVVVRINKLLKLIRDVMLSLEPFVVADDGLCLEVIPIDNTGLISDPEMQQHCRAITLRVKVNDRVIS